VVAFNVAVVQPTGSGYLTLYPSDQSAPLASTINFSFNQILCNNGLVRLGTDGKIKILPQVSGGGSVNVVIDVAGYFE
jgi:hypothetical protein